jgi:hypothetical protein
MLPSNRPQGNTLDHRACPEGRAVTRQYAVPAIGSLFNIAQFPKPPFAFFPAICFPRKRTARLSPAVQVREETPRGRAATAGNGVAIAYLILQIQRPRALTRLNFPLTFRVFRGDRSYCCRSRRRDTDTLFQKECSDNPKRFRNKTTLRLRLRFSIEGGYPEIEYD